MAARGEPIPRSKIVEVVESLGLNPEHTRQITITSAEVQVVRYIMDGDKVALHETGEPRTWMEIYPIADPK